VVTVAVLSGRAHQTQNLGRWCAALAGLVSNRQRKIGGLVRIFDSDFDKDRSPIVLI
jgi:hypothetical protein